VTVSTAPERTCIGCRRKRGQAELVRLTNEAGRVMVALPGAPGRSAYLCPELACLEAADKRRAFARAFRGPIVLDPAVRRAVARHTSDERR
jgi:predicted RNA-binding protein YlxR (DUF448 family)